MVQCNTHSMKTGCLDFGSLLWTKRSGFCATAYCSNGSTGAYIMLIDSLIQSHCKGRP